MTIKMSQLYELCLVLTVFFGFCHGSNSDVFRDTSNDKSFILPRDYDKNVAPRGDEGTTEVKVSMYILDLWTVSEEDMEFTMDVYFRQSWRDPRLSNSPKSSFGSFGANVVKQVWLPDTFIVNGREIKTMETIQESMFIRISPEGHVLFSAKLRISAGCHMDLSDFPFDTQTCNLELESYGHKSHEIYYKWVVPSGIQFYEAAGMPGFVLKKIRNQESLVSLSSGTGNYSRLCFEMELERQSKFYVYHYYMPIIFLVVVSWFSLFILPDFLAVRCLMSMVPMSIIIFLWFGTSLSLRRSVTSTKLDCYIVTSLLFTISSMIQSIIAAHLKPNEKSTEQPKETSQEHRVEVEEGEKKLPSKLNHLKRHAKKLISTSASDLDLTCRFLFPLAFAFYNLIYWLR